MKTSLQNQIKELEGKIQEIQEQFKDKLIPLSFVMKISMYSRDILTREGVIYQIENNLTTKDEANRRVYPDVFRANITMINPDLQ